MAKEKGTDEKLWSRSFVLLIFLNFIMFMGFQILMPVLPVYARALGGNEATAGLVVGIFTISAVVVRPFIGKALDVFGRKKIFLMGFFFFCLFSLSYIAASTVLMLLSLRFFHGFGWGTTSTTANTVASDIIPRSRLGEGMGYFGLTSTLAMAIAPALGLFMIQHSRFGFEGVFTFSGIAFLIALGLSLGIRYPALQPQLGKSALFEKSAFRSATIVSLLTMPYGSVVTFIALYAQQRGITNVGLFFTVYAFVLMISRPLFGRLSDQKGFGIAIVPGLFGVMLALFLLSQAKTLLFFLFAGAVYGLSFGAAMPALQAMSVQKVLPHRRGAASATYSTGFDLGIGLGSILLGTVAQVSGYSSMYLWAILPVMLALFIFFFPAKH
ncbi:MFS transporter [Desulfitobacterium metallireducens]|uniref:MFS transporter n=1 Tax=Desulfitobacterium metallireducens DSM 15288 TaxID=871968 RepID=W0ED21_9FIRM|nr:MFS transporter [Desulfitobacterium metallireducens]AHF07094.1 MFS transporter [Desulfitobacterium metallireducens DSM 15288]